MMTVLLYGFLGERFGRVHRYDAHSPAEAVRALSVTLPGFRQALIDGGAEGPPRSLRSLPPEGAAGAFGRPGGAYRVLRGGREALGADDIVAPHSARDTLRIVPVVAGAGKGFGQILLGAALIGLSFVPGIQAVSFSLGPLSVGLSSVFRSVGMNLLFSGVSQALTSTPKSQQVEAVSNKPSYAFDGAVNTAAQGNAVPVCYGRLIVGSQVISAGLSVEQIQ